MLKWKICSVWTAEYDFFIIFSLFVHNTAEVAANTAFLAISEVNHAVEGGSIFSSTLKVISFRLFLKEG